MTPLTPREAAALLQGAAGAIEAEMSVLPPAVLTHHPAPGEWCVQEVGARDGKALLDELLRRRAESETLVAALGPNDRNHLRQILANVQSYAWPHMGNARRFTTG